MGKSGFLLYLWLCACAMLLAACGDLWGTPIPGQVGEPAGSSGMDRLTPPPLEGAVPPTQVAPIPILSLATSTPESIPSLAASTPEPIPSLAASTPEPIPGQETSTPIASRLWVSPAVPELLRQTALASGLQLVEAPDDSTTRLEIFNPQSSTQNLNSSLWFYALVAPFPTTSDEVTLADIQNAWAGTPSGAFAGRPLWMDEPTLAAFTALWGEPASGSVSVSAADQLVDAAWADRPAWALLPFEALEPRWKVLRVDGQSPVSNEFNPDLYPLKINFSLDQAVFALPPSNRDANKLTVLAMTGVTALVRGTADRMEKHGVLYPGEAIRDVLRAADLTHVSNEIPFAANCPVPDPATDSLVFCSDPRYIALLEDVGVDLVELTGNHMLDYGPADFLNTLDMYDAYGWKYFGGGRDLQASLQPALLEHNGNKLAFLGCNYAGPASDWATDTSPGSAPCDFDNMVAQVTQLRSQGYLPVVTFQYIEYYYPQPTGQEQEDFRKMAEAGAVIVNGSQSHVPAAMEFDSGAFVHYGLGNLFFDQMSHLMPDGSLIYDTRNVFVDRSIFYDGRHISTELLTYMIEDYARPRPMTESEHVRFLEDIFSASGW